MKRDELGRRRGQRASGHQGWPSGFSRIRESARPSTTTYSINITVHPALHPHLYYTATAKKPFGRVTIWIHAKSETSARLRCRYSSIETTERNRSDTRRRPTDVMTYERRLLSISSSPLLNKAIMRRLCSRPGLSELIAPSRLALQTEHFRISERVQRFAHPQVARTTVDI